MRWSVLCLLAGWPGVVAAQDLSLPGDALTEERVEEATFALPASVWDEGAETRLTEGRVARRAWRLGADDRGTDALFDDIVARLTEQGYVERFACTDLNCGGYDFRFAVPTLPAPSMFVDLGDYAYGLLEGGDGSLAALLVSRAGSDLYVQLIAGGASGPVGVATDPQPVPTPGAGRATGMAWEELVREGHVALDDLTFGAGSSSLDTGPFPSLIALAEGLAADAQARIVLVGHSDATGSFEANLDLSRQRAEAVRSALVGELGVAAAQVTARGASFLAPRASNATEAGRRANRRVEAVLIR